MGEKFGSLLPQRGDAERVLEAKILLTLNGGGAAGSGGLSGTGSPQGVTTAAPGTTYLDTSTGSFWAKQTGTGSTGWLQLIA